MKDKQGYFSIIQYSEHPERAEYINIGVVLFAAEAPHVLCQFGNRPKRIKSAFNVSPGVHFDLLQVSLKNRLLAEFGEGWKREEVDRFISQRSGKIRLSQLRSILIGNPRADLSKLFADLVGEVPSKPRKQRANLKLASRLKEYGVDGLLERPNPVMLSGGIKIEAPFGYQNGAFNLIQGLSLGDEPDKALSKASPHMIEGNLLYSQTMQEKRLVVVADDTEMHDESFLSLLSSQMEQHMVRFYRMANLQPLVADIRMNYSLHH
ncbi:DUF3037 domain-containing protein [Rhizobium rosettiformans]|uniref:DUF3037 domain-containing protein n=1 Tax=Rhizobium rosettiformans TaxID=1368430 RepID=UPI0028616318|nr:DUF3037 domain-containing protein [Rhizobium rosettiformans]MDR7027350.1 hypothetical protein [Rhizobium rosettiformans]MDR7065471.1 hypothetical protein [Rhizobium rosettiformans]